MILFKMIRMARETMVLQFMDSTDWWGDCARPQMSFFIGKPMSWGTTMTWEPHRFVCTYLHVCVFAHPCVRALILCIDLYIYVYKACICKCMCKKHVHVHTSVTWHEIALHDKDRTWHTQMESCTASLRVPSTNTRFSETLGTPWGFQKCWIRDLGIANMPGSDHLCRLLFLFLWETQQPQMQLWLWWSYDRQAGNNQNASESKDMRYCWESLGKDWHWLRSSSMGSELYFSYSLDCSSRTINPKASRHVIMNGTSPKHLQTIQNDSGGMPLAFGQAIHHWGTIYRQSHDFQIAKLIQRFPTWIH